jgi:hypothetical protein
MAKPAVAVPLGCPVIASCFLPITPRTIPMMARIGAMLPMTGMNVNTNAIIPKTIDATAIYILLVEKPCLHDKLSALNRTRLDIRVTPAQGLP